MDLVEQHWFKAWKYYQSPTWHDPLGCSLPPPDPALVNFVCPTPSYGTKLAIKPHFRGSHLLNSHHMQCVLKGTRSWSNFLNKIHSINFLLETKLYRILLILLILVLWSGTWKYSLYENCFQLGNGEICPYHAK